MLPSGCLEPRIDLDLVLFVPPLKFTKHSVGGGDELNVTVIEPAWFEPYSTLEEIYRNTQLGEDIIW